MLKALEPIRPFLSKENITILKTWIVYLTMSGILLLCLDKICQNNNLRFLLLGLVAVSLSEKIVSYFIKIRDEINHP